MGRHPGEQMLGRRLGKYTLLRVLGSGGMATVYEAAHRNGHRVALKLLRPSAGISAEVRSRFLREGYAANRVGHPGAVRILDDDTLDDGTAFLVMELLEGETLMQLARRHGGKLGERLVLQAGKRLLDVLSAAHAAGVIHRDVKPENVFVTTTGEIKVLDFGAARIQEPLDGTATATGRMLGTPAFMPPEQAYGRRAEIDARSDLWSVGATLFTLIAGRPVHEARTAEEALICAATKPAPALASVASDTPPVIGSLVDKALSLEKDKRWQTAAEMSIALEAAYSEAFGGPLPPVLECSPVAQGATNDATIAKRQVPARWLARAAALALVVPLLVVAVSAHGQRQVDSAVASALTASAPTSPSSPEKSAPDVPAASVTQAPSLAERPASLHPVELGKTVPPTQPRGKPAAAPANDPTTPGPAPAARSAQQVCGVFIDEEGRKWPRRCP